MIAIVMVGMPGSGKSTYVNKFYKDFIVISRDEIRRQMHHLNSNVKTVFSKEEEQEVTNTEYFLIRDAINAQHLGLVSPGIVIDDTNLNSYFRDKLISYLKMLGYTIIVQVIEYDVNECIKHREGQIPEDVMIRIAEKADIPDSNTDDYHVDIVPKVVIDNLCNNN